MGAGVGLRAAESVAVAYTKKQLFLASIPLLFAVQQFAEGMVWIIINNPHYYYLKPTFSYLFLTFAIVVWPVWVPLSVYLLENNTIRKKLAAYSLICGALFSSVLLFCLFYYPVYTYTADHHIRYDIATHYNIPLVSKALYFSATTFSLLFSGHKKIRLTGLVILISYTISEIFFSGTIISVWCFFAAVASIILISAIRDINKSEN